MITVSTVKIWIDGKDYRPRSNKSFHDISGRDFDRLHVISLDHVIKSPDGRRIHYYYKCQCECGNICIVEKGHLIRHNIRSCGCIHRDMLIKRNTTHGGTKTRLFRIWQSMRDRCYNKRDSAYQYYGGRGISVCDEWKNNFAAFRDWAYTHGYCEGTDMPQNMRPSIERKDVNRGYSPDNCEWIPRYKQMYNTRRSAVLHFGKWKCRICEITDKIGIACADLDTKRGNGWSDNQLVEYILHPNDGLHRSGIYLYDKDNFVRLYNVKNNALKLRRLLYGY